MKKQKRKYGNRKDGVLLKSIDTIHIILANTAPSRTENEAVTNEFVDISNIDKYIKKKNEDSGEMKYTYLHILVAALSKLYEERPKLNRFISNCRYYERNDISFAFVAKKQFKDDSEEGIIIVKYEKDDPRNVVEQMHDKICEKVYRIKVENFKDDTNETMGFLTKMPAIVLRIMGKILRYLDRHGKIPMKMISVDPSYTSCFIANLGSIQMNATYHHLSNWGTNSVFLIIGEKKYKPIFKEDGSYEMKLMLPLSFTIDERIANGFYFQKSINLLKQYLENPESLENL